MGKERRKSGNHGLKYGFRPTEPRGSKSLRVFFIWNGRDDVLAFIHLAEIKTLKMFS
jgi:hypothetical protein